MTVPADSRHLVLFTYLRALLSFSYVILSFFFLCPHIFARASDLTTRKIPCSLSSHSRMPQFSSGDRSRSRTNSHRWELWRPLGKQKKKKSEKLKLLRHTTSYETMRIPPSWSLSQSYDRTLYLEPYWAVKCSLLLKRLQNTHRDTKFTATSDTGSWSFPALWNSRPVLMELTTWQSNDAFILLSDKQYDSTEAP